MIYGATTSNGVFTHAYDTDTKLRWLIQAATGVAYLHSKGIIQADVGGHNMIVTQDGTLKIIDFEGCNVDGRPALSGYEWFSYRQSTPSVNRQTDIIAFGCVIFEIIVGHPPYQEYALLDDRTSIVEELYARNQFPHVEKSPLGWVILDCWTAELDSMDKVVHALRSTRPLTLKENVIKTLTMVTKCMSCVRIR